MTVVQNFTFFNNATSTGISPILQNDNGEALTLVVSGTFTGTLVVKGSQGGVDNTLAVVNLADFSRSLSITEPGAYLVVGAYGFENISVSISEYTSGSITVTGRLCSEQ